MKQKKRVGEPAGAGDEHTLQSYADGVAPPAKPAVENRHITSVHPPSPPGPTPPFPNIVHVSTHSPSIK